MFHGGSFFLLLGGGENVISVLYHTGLWKRLDMDTDDFLKAHMKFLPLPCVFETISLCSPGWPRVC